MRSSAPRIFAAQPAQSMPLIFHDSGETTGFVVKLDIEIFLYEVLKFRIYKL
jgi:hypothetical protein